MRLDVVYAVLFLERIVQALCWWYRFVDYYIGYGVVSIHLLAA